MNKVECTFGSKCYRENLQHILEYDHNDLNRERFNKIINYYKSGKINYSDVIFTYRRGHQFGMILWVLENLNKFNYNEKKTIKQYFTTLEEDAKTDPILASRDREENIIFKGKVMTIQDLWGNELNNCKIIFSIK
jgi:hypothetical protein